MKISVYLETSVVGAYLDNEDAYRRDLTMRWWENEMNEYQAFSSALVDFELDKTAEPYRKSYLNLVKPLQKLAIPDEAAILAEGYVSRGIIQRKFMLDALHIAIASIHDVDYFMTWNFGNIANIRKQARLRLFNTNAGFHTPQIITPEFIVHTH